MKLPKQARSQASAERILAAAERRLAEGGAAALELGAVLGEARASVGSFYARFGDKDTFVRHLAERFWTRGAADWADRLEPGRFVGRPASAVIEAVAHEAVAVHRRRWSVIRALVEYGLAHPDARVLKPAREHDGILVARLTDLLLARRDQIGHPDPALAIEMACLQMTGALRTLVLVGWPKTDRGVVGDEALAVELARAFGAYLGVRR